MSEIKATGAGPPLPQGGIAPAGGAGLAPAAPQVVVPLPHGVAAVSLGGTLAQPPEGSRLNGVIIGQDDHGRPILATAQGNFIVDADIVLAQNTKLLLQILAAANGIRALVLVQDGHALQPPPEVGLMPQRAGGQGDTGAAAGHGPNASPAQPAAPPAPPPPVVRVDHARLHGVILAEPQAAVGNAAPLPGAGAGATTGAGTVAAAVMTGDFAGAVAGGLAGGLASAGAVGTAGGVAPRGDMPHLPQGTALTLQLIEVRPPATPMGAPPAAGTGIDAEASDAIMSARPQPAAGAMQPQATPSALSPALLAQTLKDTFLAATAPVAGAAPADAMRTLPGTVIGEANGRLLVHTPAGLLALDTGAHIPRGSRLTFDIVGLAPPDTSPADATADRTGDPARGFARDMARDWPALRQALELIGRVDAGAAQQAAGRLLLQPDGGLASNLLFFLAAVRGGDVRKWLGRETLGRLQAAGGDAILDRLDRDFKEIDRMAREPGGGDWRTAALPLFDGRGIAPVMLFSRQQRRKPDAPDGGREPASRFVVELALSLTGPLQLDGLVQGRNLNLILRSRRPLSNGMQRDIRAIFDDALGATGYRGSLSYQVTQRFPVMPLEDIAVHKRAVPIVA